MDVRVKSTAVVAVATGAVVLRKVLDHPPSGWPGSAMVDPRRWRAVTVNLPIEEVGGDLPEPLARLGEAVEVRVTAAPGDKGTEIAARVVGSDGPGPDVVREALREAKQMLEVGWVLEPDRHTTTRPTGLNAVLRGLTARGRKVGRL